MSDARPAATVRQGTFSRAGKNYLAVSGGNLLSRAINFAVVAYIARQLGPGAFGELSWAQASLAFGILFADWGLRTQGIRAIARSPEAAPRTVAAYLGLRIAFGLLVGTALAAFSFVAAPSHTSARLGAVYGLSVLATGILPDWVFTGMHRMAYVGVSRVIHYACYAILVFLLVRGPGDSVFIPLANALAIGGGAVFLLMVLRRKLSGWQPVLARSEWRPIVVEATPLVMSNVVIQIYYAFPILLLGWLARDVAAAYYNSAYRVVLVVYELLTLFLVSLYPVVAERWTKDPATVGTLLARVMRLIMLATVPLAVGSTVVAGPLMRLIFGAKFGASVITFQVMSWVIVLLGINGVYAQLVLLMHGRQREYLQVSAVGAVVSLAANLLLIPRYEHVGAAVAWVLAEGGVALAGYLTGRRFVTVPIARHLVKPVVASVVLAGVCWLLLAAGLEVVLVIVCGVVAYGASLLVLGALEPEEVAMVRQWIRRTPRDRMEAAP